jgi:hypothetical protein
MSKKYLFILLLLPTLAHAGIDSNKLIGWWTSECVQAKDNKIGYVQESYSFKVLNKFTFNRKWFSSSDCAGTESSKETETGDFRVGEKHNSITSSEMVYEINFKNKNAWTSGVIWIDKDYKTLKIKRSDIETSWEGKLEFTKD